MFDQTISESVPNHRGGLRSEDVIFFADPPPQIGRLRSAESTLGGGGIEMGVPLRLALAAGVAGVGYFFGSLWTGGEMGGFRLVFFVFLIFAAAGGAVILLVFTGFQHTLSFVGGDGFGFIRLKSK